MSFMLTFLFVLLMIVSAFMQAEDNPKKNYVSPALTAFNGTLILIGALSGSVPVQAGLVIFSALIMLSISDFMFERSAKNANLFPIAMVFGVLSGFTIGILFHVTAYSKGIPWWIQSIFAVAGIISAIWVYRYLQVDQALKMPVYIYLVQAVLLLAGGLSSLYVGNYYFAIWGIFIFISDSLVGIRAFPNPQKPIRWLDTRRILFLIIVLYYSAQFALVSWAI